MSGVRATVRRMIPFSGPAYAQGQHLLKLREGKAAAKALLAAGEPIWLDIGGGARAGENGWRTLDVTNECDIYWDLRKGIPFPDATVERIYSSHLFEHLTYRQGQSLMVECLRVLRPGGSFSICVPNARLYIEAYINGTALPSTWFEWAPAFNNSSAIDMVNYVAFLDGHHKYMFDEVDLLCRLKDAGFVDVDRRAFDPSIDLVERDYESIYAQGRKP